MDISIRKIKIDEKSVVIDHVSHHSTDEGIKNSVIPLKSEIRPHKDFFIAFQNLRQFAIDYMELSMFRGKKIDEKDLQKHIVTTLSIKESTDDMKVQISMNRYMSNGKCYSLTSPQISIYYETDYDRLNDLELAVKEVISEAEQYLSGSKNGEEQLSIRFMEYV